MTAFTRCVRNVALALAPAGLVLVAGAATAQDAMFGTEDDLSYAQSLWSAMQESGLTGADSLVHPRAYEGTEPHGAILQTFSTTIEVEGSEGELIVKRNYGGEGLTPGDVWDNPGENLGSVTVMFQREEGYDPDNGDWFWAKYLPDGSLDVAPNDAQMAGRVQGCIGCHTGAGGGDMLYVND